MNPRRTSAGTNATPPEKSRGEHQGNHPAATVQNPQSSDEPTGPTDSRLRPGQGRFSHGPRDLRPWGTSLPKQRPDRDQGSRPWQAPTRSEPAHTKAPSPGYQEPPIHQWAETPATGRECDREEISPTFDGGPKLIQEREQPNTQLFAENSQLALIYP
ncbi:hypothetical protein AMECASPLE_013845 [Ameca splendens]|uniref:Uncharacterized protein n=1 Tax=Ameca splendens TaxID=208324 RepID=A0ABV0YP45_9TELE